MKYGAICIYVTELKDIYIYIYVYTDVRSWNNLKEKKRKGRPVSRNNERLIPAPEALLQSTALLSYAVGH